MVEEATETQYKLGRCPRGLHSAPEHVEDDAVTLRSLSALLEDRGQLIVLTLTDAITTAASIAC